jgi:signal transduction histidine kinase
MLLHDDDIESVVLRESIRARIVVAPVSILTTFASIFLYIPFLISLDVAYAQIALWAVPIIVLMLGRGMLSHRIKQGLDGYGSSGLARADQMLRISSIVNQMTVGLGIWIVQSPSADLFVVPLFMTLIVVIWSIGVLANLFSDFRSFIISMPLMIGENAAFWIMLGGIGISIGLSMMFAAVFMVFLVRRGTEIFRESILMRYAKDELVTSLEDARTRIQHALLEAQAANESKAYFMAAASHDIKQPLHALGLLTDTLLMSKPPESAVPILQIQRESISQMSAHFDALMDMGRFEGGYFELRPQRFRLGRFAARIDLEIAPLCAEKDLAWRLDMADAQVFTDEELLLRVLRNLLVNAVRFTASGTVSCTARIRGDRIEFRVADTGCGIPSEHHEAVFRQFVRLDHDGVRSSGAGLGLSIVEKIATALGLGLQMTSMPGKGTEFRFYLPAILESQHSSTTPADSAEISNSPAHGL